MKKLLSFFICIIFLSSLLVTLIPKQEEASTNNISVKYQAHVQDIGWQNWVTNGTRAGTEGQGKRIEAFKIQIDGLPSGAKIEYQAHVEDIGWQNWVSNGQLAGTTGKRKSVEAFRIRLVNMDDYIIEYRAHVQDIGWQDWTTNGSTAGTEGQRKRVEAIQIRIVKKISQDSKVNYMTHIQDIGWESWKTEGALSGTQGQGKRLEAIKISLSDELKAKGSIKYQTHIQDIGWQNWVTDGARAGTEGKSKRIEAIRIQLQGLSEYTVEYKVHIQDKGWSDWFIDGETAGTVGQGKRLEGIMIRIVPKYKREYFGIDISYYQQTVDYDKLMATGKVDFMIARSGWYSSSKGEFVVDAQMERNYKEAKKRGIPLGTYIYSYATNVQEAKDEANALVQYFKSTGKSFELPVFFDIEDDKYQGNLSKQLRTDMANAFCKILKDAGYKAGIYSSATWLLTKLDLTQIPQDYSIWVASWGVNDGEIPGDKFKFPGNHDIWQYTSKGSIDGIEGDVDFNICYNRYWV